MKAERIPENELVDGGFYRLYSRNLKAGVYNASQRAFIGIREKFSHFFLATEYDWETGEPHGTAIPYEKIADCPIRPISPHAPTNDDPFKDNDPLYQWIETTLG
jgi:hypothetical protein